MELKCMYIDSLTVQSWNLVFIKSSRNPICFYKEYLCDFKVGVSFYSHGARVKIQL
jgi:hypothetical protein